MNLTVQPNYYPKTTNYRKNQNTTNRNSYPSSRMASNISFAANNEFDLNAEIERQLGQRSGFAKALGLGKGAARDRAYHKLAGFNMARQGREEEANRTLVQIKEQMERDRVESERRMAAKDEETRLLRENLDELRKNGGNSEEMKALKEQLAQIATERAKEKEKFEKETEAFRNIRNEHEDLSKIRAGKGWDKIAGHAEIKKHLDEIFMQKLALEKGGTNVKMPNGILFYGPQSTGKTFFARAFAEQSKCNFIEINMDQSDERILEELHQACQKSRELYNSSPDKKRTIILLDEFDSIAQLEKDEKGKVISDKNVAKLKNILQKCAEDSKCTIFMTTNYPLRIDSELLAPHRIPTQIYLGPPDLEDSAEIFKHYLKGTKQPIDCNKLAEEVMQARETNHAYSAGMIAQIVTDCREAVARTSQRLTQNDLVSKIREVGPDITPAKLTRFIDAIEKMAKTVR